MKRRALLLLCLLAPLAPTAAPLAATGFGLFQHGGRGAAQAGAFVARADDPSAVRSNPAGLARLDGFQLQAGLDFAAPKDQFDSAGRSDTPNHVIQFPAALYATWNPDGLDLPLTFGLGVDSPFWTIEDWDTALFPGRFDTRRQEATFFELRPTVAWAIGERFSIGGSLRYVKGALETSWATTETFAGSSSPLVEAEIESEAAAQVDGLGFDLGVQYTAPGWGLGLVLGSGVSLDGSGDIDYFPHEELTDGGAEIAFARRFVASSAAMDFELPPSLALGLWWGLGDNVKLEGDVVWSGWSALDRTRVDIGIDPYSAPPPAVDRRRDWEDVVSLRLGVDWTLSEMWSLGGGLAFEPSPVPDSTIEPGFPQGDATVLSVGASCNFEGLSFDLGYSYHSYDDRKALLDGRNPPYPGTFSSRSQVFSVSARWRR
jgi:long-chain fatty acid transport protein